MYIEIPEKRAEIVLSLLDEEIDSIVKSVSDCERERMLRFNDLVMTRDSLLKDLAYEREKNSRTEK